MSALVLKSKNSLNINIESLDFTLYKQRVMDDGGFIANEQAVRDVFQFCIDNNLTESEVFSATSPNWGIKLTGAKPKKLYSLFGEAGDIDVTVGTPASINYDTTSYDSPVIELKASSTNALKTVGVANNVNSSGVFVIARAPMLAAGANYGTSLAFALGELVDVTAEASVNKRNNSIYFTRTVGTVLADGWSLLGYGYGTQGNVNSVGVLSDMSQWRNVATFLTNGKMELISDGNVISTDNTVIPSSYINNLYFTIGRSRNSSVPELVWNSPLYGSVAEAWCLINTTSDKMKVLSTRSFS